MRRFFLHRLVALATFVALLVSCSTPLERVAETTVVPATSVPTVAASPTVVPTLATTPTVEPSATIATTPTVEPSATLASTATVEPSATLASTATEVTPTDAATAEPTVATTAEAATTVPLSETPIVTPTTVIAEGASADGCGDAHAATREESIDLNADGQALAPALDTFNQYRLDLDLDREQATVIGRQTLIYTNRTGAPLPDLLFHLYPNLPEFGGSLEIACASIDGGPVTTTIEDGWLLRVPFAAPLAPDATASVNLHWTTTTPRGSGTRLYGAFNAEDDLWALASFYPHLAIRVGDAWDTLRPNGWGDFVNSDMALYHAQIRTSEGQLVTSGRTASTCDAGRCNATVAAGPQRDLTLTLLQGWEQERRTVGGTDVVSWFPAAWRVAGEASLELTADSTERYNQAYGAYPYTELDVVPIPAAGFAGVEYPGLIMISESFYQSPVDPLAELQGVVVHEVAHMWFFNTVGNDVLREPWLDEGITSYTEQFLYPELSGRGTPPNVNARTQRLAELGYDDEQIDEPVASYGTPRAYVAVIYSRAPLLLQALRREVGDDTFFQIMQEYYRRNAFGRATTGGFQSVAEEVAGRQLDDFFIPWFGADTNAP